MSTVKRPRTQARQARTRQRLREVGHDLFATVGVDACTIQQITDAADIGFGTFYNYYDTKEDLADEVLACLIDNIGQLNDAITAELGETDPVRIVANSVRTVIREFIANPVFHWWVDRLVLMVDRMRVGFAVYGIRDIERAVASGDYHLIANDAELAWSQLIWLTAAAARDILAGVHDPSQVADLTEGVLRVMGVDPAVAHDAVSTVLPPSPNLPVDFSISIPAMP